LKKSTLKAMNIALNPEQEQFIKSQIDIGSFKSADEAVSQAFKLLEEKYQSQESWIADTRAKVDLAIAELDRGEGVELDVAVEQLRQKFQQKKANI
jgi:antitoxin ParD1/3/4